ncbi:hypothetical protein INS49_002522 [Diaporthe citri]|uniref:uncharacterized protein n=1 Tax=Diaporthe citri TaxID=83186 RepID=UPI001C7F3547|nr:uncharacterized protein INS49_002522 [Diaporthe citri]KAG6368317.1 hypothetical protein INS49_002522 [Diaporthe citri]
MGTFLSTRKSSKTSVDYRNSGRPPGWPTSYDIIRPSRAQQPQTQAFTLFKLLPAELRVFVWEFAFYATPGPSGPRVHFLEPMAKPNDDDFVSWWDRDGQYCHRHYVPGCQRGQRIHWEVSGSTDDPGFWWSRRELLAVCVEAREVFLKLNQKATFDPVHRPHARQKISDMIRTTDIMCIRAGTATCGSWKSPKTDELLPNGVRQICYPNERPSPRRLALELPTAAEYQLGPTPRSLLVFVPYWLSMYGPKHGFMYFGLLEIVYILDQGIKPRAQYDCQEDMPSEMYTEVFEGNHGSKFVAIDPEDRRAVQHWIIPEYCRAALELRGPFSLLPLLVPPTTFGPISGPSRFEWQYIHSNRYLKYKLRFLACVRECSQTQQLGDDRPYSGFAFT